MALKYSTSVRNAQLDAIETTISTAPLLQIWSGAVPANCAAVPAGTKLAEFALPSDWLLAADSGSKAKNGTWSGSASADGTAAFFRITDSAGTTCHMQGTVSASGGGGDAIIDNTSIANGQTVTVSSFSIAAGNA